MSESESLPRPKRRVRYRGTHPRRFEEKYKEHDPQKYAETVQKVMDSGKTPAGMHRPICVTEILDALQPKPGEVAIDATLGYGGHAREILQRISPGGRLIGFDVDPIELPRTEARLREAGFASDVFTAVHSNFAGIPKALTNLGIAGANILVADLGVSSMQFDQPDRGFSFKHDGPLDMRMNPSRGQPASALLENLSEEKLANLLVQNSDEPHAMEIARAIVQRRGSLRRTTDLSELVRASIRGSKDEIEISVRRVFQALRIAVNDEFSALDALLRSLPSILLPGGRAAILTFHSGEDRRVKNAFKKYRDEGAFATISEEVVRPSPEEIRANPRAAPAKLRWAVRSSAT